MGRPLLVPRAPACQRTVGHLLVCCISNFVPVKNDSPGVSASTRKSSLSIYHLSLPYPESSGIFNISFLVFIFS